MPAKQPTIFRTFRPTHPTVASFVDYYYLDFKPDNQSHTFECFPHFNNTISLYRSHRRPDINHIYYEPTAPPLQIFTPVRKFVLRMEQTGPVHRVVIVFHALGPQQFWPDQSFNDFCANYPFFTPAELDKVFQTNNADMLVAVLDKALMLRFSPHPIKILDRAVSYLFEYQDDFLVSTMANTLGISRRHLQRQFKAAIGISIKEFHQIIVFRGVVERRLTSTTTPSLTALAYRANFSDQSHMIRVFHKLTRNAPREFFQKGRLHGQADTFWHQIS